MGYETRGIPLDTMVTDMDWHMTFYKEAAEGKKDQVSCPASQPACLTISLSSLRPGSPLGGQASRGTSISSLTRRASSAGQLTASPSLPHIPPHMWACLSLCVQVQG